MYVMRNARATLEQNHSAKPANDRNGVRASHGQNHLATGHGPRSGGSSGAKIAAGAAARSSIKYAMTSATAIAAIADSRSPGRAVCTMTTAAKPASASVKSTNWPTVTGTLKTWSAHRGSTRAGSRVISAYVRYARPGV